MYTAEIVTVKIGNWKIWKGLKCPKWGKYFMGKKSKNVNIWPD